MRNPGQRLGVWSELVTLPTLLSVALISCGGASNNPSSTSLNDDMTGTITVAYSTTYVFDSDDTSVIWWDKVKKEFEAAYPKAKLNLQGFNGTDVDLVNKVALEYKNPSTTPDVFMLPTGYVGQWVGSDYLLPLDSFVTDCNSVVFDVDHDFAGCIPGCHEILRRQGLLTSIECLDPNEKLSAGQSEGIDRLYATYPELHDDAFVAANLERWRN